MFKPYIQLKLFILQDIQKVMHVVVTNLHSHKAKCMCMCLYVFVVVRACVRACVRALEKCMLLEGNLGK